MKNKPTISATDDQTQKKLDLVEKWACMIQRNCGTEQNSDKQLACVKAIAQNAAFLLCDCRGVLGNVIFINFGTASKCAVITLNFKQQGLAQSNATN